MKLFDPNNPNERKKAIAAAVLGAVALIVLGYVFFGSSGDSKRLQVNLPKPTPGRPAPVVGTNNQPAEDGDIDNLGPVNVNRILPGVPEPNRNIFAYYEPTPVPTPLVPPPTPTPTPPPPLILSAVTPANVFARTADFRLQALGDKFTPAIRITVDGNELATSFLSAQQVAATVPAAMIANPGARQVMVRTVDGKLYSNVLTLTVTPPPVPNYSYIGIIGKPRANDIAMLQNKSNKELLNVVRGDVLEGRFRVTSISEHEVVLVDTNLKIKHTIPFTAESNVEGSSPFVRPTPRPTDEP